MAPDNPPVKTDITHVLGDALLDDTGAAPDPAVIKLLRDQGMTDDQIRAVLGLKSDTSL
jgi:hypothetical protein